ncbi:MAG: hypothetical protein RL215_165, partial [Planctomycetota bacterium]
MLIVLVAMGLVIVVVVSVLLFAARLHASGDSPRWWGGLPSVEACGLWVSSLVRGTLTRLDSVPAGLTLGTDTGAFGLGCFMLIVLVAM